MKTYKYYLTVFLLYSVTYTSWLSAQDLGLSEAIESKIDSFIVSCMEKGSSPGISVSIIKGNETVFAKGYGYADIENKIPVTPSTLFEIGSNSKAFTGLGIVLLEKRGLINLNHPVQKYIPWFITKHEGQEHTIKLRHLLYHTSGITYMALKNIEPGNSADALERTVRNIMDLPLMFIPGSEFGYSTSNYDVLGYIIEVVTGQPYEQFMMEEILQPLQLENTYLDREACFQHPDMAVGYKLGFAGNKKQFAPTYRGNLPAGYIISSSLDMAQWLKINLQTYSQEALDNDVIQAALRPDTSVAPTLVIPYSAPFQYAAGWLVFDQDNRVSHGGGNPNFSSYLTFYPKEELGIVVLGNRNSSHPYGICQGIFDILKNQSPQAIPTDILLLSNHILLGLFGLGLLLMILSARGTYNLYKRIKGKKRCYAATKKVKGLLWPAVLVVITGLFLYFLPVVAYFGFPWSLIEVWAPFTIKPALIVLFLGLVFQYVILYLKKLFPLSKG